MKNRCRGQVIVVCMAIFAVASCHSAAVAVDSLVDWTAQNTVMPSFTSNNFDPSLNNYGPISNTSVGGQFESKLNFASEVTDAVIPNIDVAHVYLSDSSLDVAGGVLDFTSQLHMEGTITFDANGATEPNLCFCWYNSGDTRHRIGLGISNLSVAQGGAVADHLRIDFGYGATGGNRFYFVSADGTADQTNNNSLLPDGTYQFTFDYTPGPSGMAGGTMSVTVGNFFRTISQLETQPWDTDVFTFDRFGIVQRSTTNTAQDGSYQLVFSNITYTGGTAVPEPAICWLLLFMGLPGFRSRGSMALIPGRRRRGCDCQ